MTYNYSNPRKEFTTDSWPWGGKQKTKAVFTVEVDPKRGERVVRVVTDPKTGKKAMPKKLTYAREMVIVDGDDGKTYIAELSFYGHITISCGDMRFHEETIHANSPRYPALRAFFKWGADTARPKDDGTLGAVSAREGEQLEHGTIQQAD